MPFSRHQLNLAMKALDEGVPCGAPRRVDMQERWDDKGVFVVVPNPEPTFIKKGDRKIRTNADPLPDPHGRAFLVVDPKTLKVTCAACTAAKERK